ncbi:MAG: cadherin-like beta sandwich domain-containing protein [Clostridia bacterium]|nr:cadherin-like beta sandwich domain-containing protein [Clostridia bacterium]
MKKIKNIVILFIIIILCSLINTKSYAETQMNIVTDKKEIQQDEELNIKVEIKNAQVAAFTLEIFWDSSILEYLQGPDNSNYSNNRIIYTWVSNTGKNKQDIKTEQFQFKVLKEENANITVLGEFYNEQGKKIEIENSNIELELKENEKSMTETSETMKQVGASDSTSLSVLRLNHEGISPEFQKDKKEYYFVTDDKIDNLEVTAIPENPNATVNITGNQNLKIGKNLIEIDVISEDKTKKDSYKIYVTKTTNIEIANANLEILAVREGSLNPEFNYNITDYKIEIPNETTKIEILAIPQSEKAKVSILGNNEMKVGNNYIQINVIAEDGITNKKYELNVYRRNEKEQIQYEQEKQYQAEI